MRQYNLKTDKCSVRVNDAAHTSAAAAAAAGTTGVRAPKRRVVVDEAEEAAPATPSKLSHAGRNA